MSSGLVKCDCIECQSGMAMLDPVNGMHVDFCQNCGRACCCGSGPTHVSCPCCHQCQQGKCLEKEDAEEEEAEVIEPPKKKQNVTKKATTPKIPLAEQSEIRMVRASSQQGEFLAENVLIDDNGKTFWKSEPVKRKDRKEQCVEFQLAPDKSVRRLGSVSVDETRQVGLSDFRIDFSEDGTLWKRGHSLWGTSSAGDGVRSNHDLGNIVARSVRIVCKKPRSFNSGVGFAFVQFNRVAKMREPGGILCDEEESGDC